jgi:type IV fimbrial biogenesis protein FimT
MQAPSQTPGAGMFTFRTATISRQSGVNLIETLMGLLLASIVLAYAVPSFSQLMRARHLQPTTQQLYIAFQLARSEALARGRRVAVAARDGAWTHGWDVFVDVNDNGRYDAGDIKIRSFEPIAENMTITPAFGATYAGLAIAYDPLGKPVRPGNQGLVLGHLTVTQGGQMRSLCFATLRVRIVTGTDCS